MSINHKFKYDTIKIPEIVTKMIDDIIIEADGFFASRTDVIKYALLEFVDKRKRDRREDDEHKYRFRREGLERSPCSCKGTSEAGEIDGRTAYSDSRESGAGTGENNPSHATS
jgi:Arc/MetJ-type ribon-helix-helix transcriptional regulator